MWQRVTGLGLLQLLGTVPTVIIVITVITVRNEAMMGRQDGLYMVMGNKNQVPYIHAHQVCVGLYVW